MSRSYIRLLVPPLAVTLAAACGRGQVVPQRLAARAALQPAVPMEASHAHIVPGETLRFEISLRGFVGGEASFATGNPGVLNGRRVVIIKSRLETVGIVAAIKEVRDDVVTHIDVASGAPVYLYADISLGSQEAVVESWFDANRADVQFQAKGKEQRQYRVRIPPNAMVFDSQSIFGVLRGWRPADGERSFFYVLSGKRLWHNSVVAKGIVEISTPLGRFRALRIDGVATPLGDDMSPDPRKGPRKFALWISDDPARRPLRVTATTEYGDAKAELIEHHWPANKVARH